MPKQPNPDNMDTPQEIGDRISAAVKRDPNTPRQSRKPDAGEAGKTTKKPSK
jgi:hypothetical protein